MRQRDRDRPDVASAPADAEPQQHGAQSARKDRHGYSLDRRLEPGLRAELPASLTQRQLFQGKVTTMTSTDHAPAGSGALPVVLGGPPRTAVATAPWPRP